MDTIKVDILNPKARRLLQELADQDLIVIRESEENDFFEVLKKLRSKSAISPDPDEIAHLVVEVRSERYNK